MRDRVFIRGADKAVPKYSSNGMEYIARHVTTWEDSKMSSIKRHRAIVTVADTRMVPPQLLLFRSYRPEMPEEACEHYKFLDPTKVELWKTLRCTTYDSSFFWNIKKKFSARLHTSSSHSMGFLMVVWLRTIRRLHWSLISSSRINLKNRLRKAHLNEKTVETGRLDVSFHLEQEYFQRKRLMESIWLWRMRLVRPFTRPFTRNLQERRTFFFQLVLN